MPGGPLPCAAAWAVSGRGAAALATSEPPMDSQAIFTPNAKGPTDAMSIGSKAFAVLALAVPLN